MLSYLFMGSPPFAATILEALCDRIGPPSAVVTQLAKATGRGQKIVPTAVEFFARSRNLNILATLDVNAEPTLSALKTFEPDLVLVAAFGQLLKRDVLSLARLYPLNVHASLLPEYRGAAPIQRAIWDGHTTTGITIQKMARKLDTGDILVQRELAILPDETSGELMNRLAHVGGDCLVEAVEKIERNEAIFVPQDEARATYARKIERTDSPIDWARPARALHCQIRALQPWPVAETRIGGERLKIFKADVVEGGPALEPGALLCDAKSSLIVGCGERTALALKEVQLENRKRVSIRDFLSAYRGSFPHLRVG